MVSQCTTLIFLDFSPWVLKNSASVAPLEVQRIGPHGVASKVVIKASRKAGRWHIRHRVTDPIACQRPTFGRYPYRFFHYVDFSFHPSPEQFGVNLIRFTLQGLPDCFQIGVRERSAIFGHARLFCRIPHQMESPGTVPWRRMPGDYRDASHRGPHRSLFFERSLEVF